MESVFGSVEPDGSSIELYFFHQIPLIDAFKGQIKDSIIQEFRISDEKVIKKILQHWRFPDYSGVQGLPIYHLELSKDHQFTLSCSLSADLAMIISDGHHLQFFPDSLLKYKEDFIPIYGVGIEVESPKEAISLMRSVKDMGGYMPFHNSDSHPYDFEKYPGQITLSYPYEMIPDSVEDIYDFVVGQLPFKGILKRGQLSNDTSGISNDLDPFSIENIEDQLHDRTVKIELFCARPTVLPEEFTVLTKWEEIGEIKMTIYNLTPEEIISLAKDMGIELRLVNSPDNGG